MHFYRNYNRDKGNWLRRGMIAGMLACLFLSLGATATVTAAGNDSLPARDMGAPVRLMIPSIKVDAPIENVGLMPDGAMGTPKDFLDTAWYQFGPRPGEQGNAVIAGHVDSVSKGAVFWDLRQLKPGDDIVVMSDDGIAHHFTMIGSEKYALGDAPLNEIFGPADGAHLNLITCDADTPFNQSSHEYGGHLLIHADATP